MHPALNKNLFLVKEHIGIFKAANNYDIYDPDNGQISLECREPNLGFFTKLLRFSDYKTMTPFEVVVSSPDGQKILTVKRGIAFILSDVDVYDGEDNLVGRFKQKLFSIGGKFDVLNPAGEVLCKFKGNWISWDFGFEKDGVEFAHVSKKWAGLGKEFFTSADNYVLKIDERIPADNPLRILILAAVMCIDMVLKE